MSMQIRTFANPNEIETRIYTPSAPAHGAARQWVRNINVWVLVVRSGAGIGNINSTAIIRRYQVAREVDSRYGGMRSACGQAMARAAEIRDQVDAAIAAQAAIEQMYAA